MRIAIIGSGMAGLSCADVLTKSGHEVRVFDKGRGPGGRMSTRRATTSAGEASFDHGAQSFEAHDKGFQRVVMSWSKLGLVAPWPATKTNSWVGVPSMSAIVKHMVSSHTVEFGFLVKAIVRKNQQWQVIGEAESRNGFDSVVVAIPAEQAASIVSLHDLSMTRAAMASCAQPCWAAMFAFADTVLDARSFIENVGPISSAVRNSGKPGRGAIECWVVQADETWSSNHLSSSSDFIAKQLLEKLRDAVGGQLPLVIHQTAHRWRYAHSQGTGQGALWNSDIGLGMCGDWLLGPHVESAWQSGKALALQVTEKTALVEVDVKSP